MHIVGLVAWRVIRITQMTVFIMEKTKDQILMEKLRRAGHRTRRSLGVGPRPPRGMGGPHGGMMGPGPRGPMGMPPRRGPEDERAMPREIVLLNVLEAGETGIRQKDIAENLGIRPSSLSEQIDALEADRYLERVANPEDRRSTLIVLTEKGKARAWEVQDDRRKAAEEFCSKLTEAEKDTLIALLDKLLAEPEKEKEE